MLNFKKRSRFIVIAAVLLVSVLTVGFAVNRITYEPSGEMNLAIVNNSSAEIFSIGLFYDNQSGGVQNADNSPFKKGETIHFQIGERKSLDFKVQISDKDWNVLAEGWFTKDFTHNSTERIYLYVVDGEDGKFYITDYSNIISTQTIKDMLKKYLPAEVFDNMPDFREQNLDDERLLWLWSAWDSEEEVFIHKIEFTLSNNALSFYHYMNYDFKSIPENNITIEQAFELVKEFAKDFISESENLIFEREPAYYSLYDPGKVESWVAEYNGIRYIVMANLMYGYIELFTVEGMIVDSITIGGVEYNTDITELNLMYVDLSNEDIMLLKDMTNLIWLNLNGTGISDVSPLKDLRSIKTLSLSNNKISDFSVLESLTNLTWLDLQNTGIENLEVLYGLVNLEVLTLERNLLTQQQIDDLQAVLPNCTIHYDKAVG